MLSWRQQEQISRAGALEAGGLQLVNRLAGLAVSPARGWHPFPAPSVADAGHGLPTTRGAAELIAQTASCGGAAAPQPGRHGEQLLGWPDSTGPPAPTPGGGCTGAWCWRVCRFYHQLLQNLFEGLDDATEALAAEGPAHRCGSIAAGLPPRSIEPTATDVEDIGWLVSVSISPRKKKRMARKRLLPYRRLSRRSPSCSPRTDSLALPGGELLWGGCGC